MPWNGNYNVNTRKYKLEIGLSRGDATVLLPVIGILIKLQKMTLLGVYFIETKAGHVMILQEFLGFFLRNFPEIRVLS